MKRPLISVVTPSFNQGRFIEETIRSVVDQEFTDWEHIVVDGGSTDDTLAILRRYPHLKWTSEPDRGQAHAVNKGFAAARGEIIAWLNSDDTYFPHTLATVARELGEHEERQVIMGRCEFTEVDGTRTGTFHPSAFSGHSRVVEIWKGYTIPQPSVFFRRNVLERCGNLDEDLYFVLDYDFFLRMSREYWFHTVDEVLSTYRLQPQSKTLEIDEAELLEHSIEVSRRYWGPVFFPSYWRYAASLRRSQKPLRFTANRWWTEGAQQYSIGNRASGIARMVAAGAIFPPLLLRRGRYPLVEAARRMVGRRQVERLASVVRGTSPTTGEIESIYGDRWAGPKARATFDNPGGATHIELDGEVVLSHFFNSPLRLALSANDHDLGEHELAESGPFQLSIQLPQAVQRAREAEISITCDKSFVPWELGLSSDRRELAFIVNRLALVSHD